LARHRIIVGISGASGVVYGLRALERLAEAGVETHLVLTRSAALTIGYELEMPLEAVKAKAAVVHPLADVGASIASGSFRTEGMLVAPCSMRSLAAIATGNTDNLLTRAADVVLCPGLAADGHGNRLGRGGGSYDRALRRVRIGAPRWVLLYDEERLASVPVDEHDVPVSGTITPSGLIRC